MEHQTRGSRVIRPSEPAYYIVDCRIFSPPCCLLAEMMETGLSVLWAPCTHFLSRPDQQVRNWMYQSLYFRTLYLLARQNKKLSNWWISKKFREFNCSSTFHCKTFLLSYISLEGLLRFEVQSDSIWFVILQKKRY